MRTSAATHCSGVWHSWAERDRGGVRVVGDGQGPTVKKCPALRVASWAFVRGVMVRLLGAPDLRRRGVWRGHGEQARGGDGVVERWAALAGVADQHGAGEMHGGCDGVGVDGDDRVGGWVGGGVGVVCGWSAGEQGEGGGHDAHVVGLLMPPPGVGGGG